MCKLAVVAPCGPAAATKYTQSKNRARFWRRARIPVIWLSFTFTQGIWANNVFQIQIYAVLSLLDSDCRVVFNAAQRRHQAYVLQTAGIGDLDYMPVYSLVRIAGCAKNNDHRTASEVSKYCTKFFLKQVDVGF